MITPGGLITIILVGAIAGFIAGKITKGRGSGLIVNTIVGLIGAMLFGIIFHQLNLTNSELLNQIIGATIGSIILLLVIGALKKAA